VAQEDPIFRTICKVLYERAIDLHCVYGERLQVPQSCMTGAKIVESDTAARVAQRVDEPNGFLNIVECRCFGVRR
jgi:hypothetical protein